MLKKALVLSVLSIFLFFSAHPASANDDFKYFSEYTVKFKINKWLDVFSHPEMRWRDDASEWQTYFFRNGFIAHPFPFLDLGTNYVFNRIKSSTRMNGPWQTVNTIELDGTVKFPVWKFKFSDRSRVEFFVNEDARPTQRYRNLAKLAYPTEIKKFKFTPYVSEELYVNFEGQGYNQNWVTWGFTKQWFKHFEAGVYYRLESLKNNTDHFDTSHILGTEITLSF